MRLVETIPGMGGRGIKENDGGGWIQPCYIVSTFVNVTLYPQYNNNYSNEENSMQELYNNFAKIKCVSERKIWRHT
jgi:hypothetical protein